MALTFKNLQDEVLRWIDEVDNAEIVLDNVKQALNEANSQRVAEQQWDFMISEPAFTLTLVPGQREYTLDPTASKPIYFYNRTAARVLTQVPLRSLLQIETATYVPNDADTSKYVLSGGQFVTLFTPTTADVIEYKAYLLPVEMVNDADEPNIPYPYSRLLVYDALLAICAYSEDINPTKLEFWAEQARKLEAGLLQHSLDTDTLNSVSTRVRDVETFY